MNFEDDAPDDEFPPPPSLVEVEVEGDTVVWVRVAEDWKDHVMPSGLLVQVRAAVIQAGAPRASWVNSIDLTKVSIPELREFNALLREARAEERDDTWQEEVRTRHFVARWRDGVLVGLNGDVEWMAEVPRQALCEELTQAVSAPDHTPAPNTARRRFVRFMEERS